MIVIAAFIIVGVVLVFAAGIAFTYATSREHGQVVVRRRRPPCRPLDPADLPGLTDQDRAWVRHHQQLAGTIDSHAESDAWGALYDKAIEDYIRHQKASLT